MRLTTPQLLKLRNLARLAFELTSTQRARAAAYQRLTEYQRNNGHRIAHLEQELGKLGGSLAPKDLRAARDEIEQLRELTAQAAAEAAVLQRDIEAARAYVLPMTAAVDELVRFAGVSRAELGIDFEAAATRGRTVL